MIPDQSLRNAIRARQVDQTRALLATSTDVNAPDDKGETLLMVAASVGSPEIVEMLLAAGADVTPRDKAGYTAQDSAYWHGEYRMGAYTPECLRIVEMLKKASPTDAKQQSIT